MFSRTSKLIMFLLLIENLIFMLNADYQYFIFFKYI